MAKVMIVDDEPGIRFVVRKMLEGAGYEVVEAESGEESLKKLEKEHVNLVLMDVMMPGIDGWEATKRIKESGKGRVVMFTVCSEEEDMEKSFEYAGSDGHVNKPIVKEQLLSTVKWVLQNVPEEKMEEL